MPKYVVNAQSIMNYKFELEAENEQEAEEMLKTWIADDFEEYKTNGEWRIDVTDPEDNN